MDICRRNFVIEDKSMLNINADAILVAIITLAVLFSPSCISIHLLLLGWAGSSPKEYVS